MVISVSRTCSEVKKPWEEAAARAGLWSVCGQLSGDQLSRDQKDEFFTYGGREFWVRDQEGLTP